MVNAFFTRGVVGSTVDNELDLGGLAVYRGADSPTTDVAGRFAMVVRVVGWSAFVVGLVVGFVGYATDAYSGFVATTLMFGVWLVGGVLAAFVAERTRGEISGRSDDGSSPSWGAWDGDAWKRGGGP